MISTILALILSSTANPVPPSISLIGFSECDIRQMAADEGSDHTYCCWSWRGCWAWVDGEWHRYRQWDCLSSRETPDRFSLWRCNVCRNGNGHLPRQHIDTKDRSQRRKL